MELIIFTASLMFFMLFGLPIALVLALCSIILMFVLGTGDMANIAQQMVNGTNNFPLMAIPFFMLAGEIMSHGGLSQRIVNFANLSVGRIKGGLGYAAILASIIFAGLTGAAAAESAALGGILLPLMAAAGYKSERSAALICSGSIIGPIIPPSIPFILIGSTVGISVTRLFMAGIVPGLIIGVMLMVTWFIIVKKDGYSDVKKYTFRESLVIIKESIPALILPAILLLGIRFGMFTPTEGGAFAVVYAFLICAFWYKEFTVEKYITVCINAAKNTAIVMFIVAAATAVGWYITVAQIPDQAAAILSGFLDKPIMLMVVLNIFLLVMGMILDITPNILIFAPVFYPVIVKAGIDPVYFGLVMVLNLVIGLITPPVGIVLYIGCSIGKVAFGDLVKSLTPFLIAEMVVLILMIFIPELVTVPVKFFMGEM